MLLIRQSSSMRQPNIRTPEQESYNIDFGLKSSARRPAPL
jgi:hypothetical protein